MTHLALSDYTFCGVHIDSLRNNAQLVIINSVFDQAVVNFKLDKNCCKLCLIALEDELALQLHKHGWNEEDINGLI